MCLFQIVIEAVVSIKTSLNADHWDSGIERFRRTAHVMSKPLVLWTRAPIEPPKVLVQSYDQSSAVLYWEKPILMSIIGKVCSKHWAVSGWECCMKQVLESAQSFAERLQFLYSHHRVASPKWSDYSRMIWRNVRLFQSKSLVSLFLVIHRELRGWNHFTEQKKYTSPSPNRLSVY